MYLFECEATFEADPDAVWKAWTDVARWPEWDVSKEIAQLDGPFEPGTRGWARQRGNLGGSFTITAVDAGRGWVTECPMPLGKVIFDHRVEPVAGGFVRVVKRVEVEGACGPLVRMFAPKMRRDITASLAALQHQLSRQTTVIYRFAVGRLSCAVVSDGQMEPPLAPPLEAFFTPGTGVPDRELREALAAEGQGRTMVECGYNCLLVETPDGRALIDTGLGARFLGYGPLIEPLVGRLGGQLAEAGATELSAVLFTHLHQDHARGATWSGELTFPAATGFAHAAEVTFQSSSGRSPGDDEHRAAALEAIRLFGERLRPFGHGDEVLPHVRAVDAAGHTPGHTAFMLESRGERLLCAGDSFYDSLQLSHPGWRTPWDHDAERSVLSRRRLLGRAADENLLVHAYHMPYPGLGRVERHGSAFRWSPVAQLPPPGRRCWCEGVPAEICGMRSQPSIARQPR